MGRPYRPVAPRLAGGVAAARIRRFAREANLYRLTPQPKRYDGERWAAFQFALPGGGEHLVYVFRLPNSTAQRRVRLRAGTGCALHHRVVVRGHGY